jgi:hypothetical protein
MEYRISLPFHAFFLHLLPRAGGRCICRTLTTVLLKAGIQLRWSCSQSRFRAFACSPPSRSQSQASLWPMDLFLDEIPDANCYCDDIIIPIAIASKQACSPLSLDSLQPPPLTQPPPALRDWYHTRTMASTDYLCLVVLSGISCLHK